ncbi:MAG: MarR family winged helix-turn-helix transcriptional regulator [Bryobacteraceae bacterium]
MRNGRTARDVEAFLGSTLVFSRAVTEVVDVQVLAEAAQDRLTAPQFTALRLAEQQPLTIGELAALLDVSNAAASKTVDRLVRRGLAVRREGSKDRRATEVRLTGRGRALMARYETARAAMLAKAFGEFPAQQLRRTARLLDRLSSSLVSHSSNNGKTCLRCHVYGAERCPVSGSTEGCRNGGSRGRE